MKKIFIAWLILPLVFLLTACALGGDYQFGSIKIPLILIYGVVVVAIWMKFRDRKKK